MSACIEARPAAPALTSLALDATPHVVSTPAAGTPTANTQPLTPVWPGQGVLCFRVDQAHYAVDILQVREIRNAEPALRIAGASAAVRGVLHLRGLVVPLVCLRRYWQADALAEQEGSAAQQEGGAVVVVDDGRGGRVAALVDAVTDVVAVEPAQFRAAPVLTLQAGSDAPGQLLGLIDARPSADSALADTGLLQWLDLSGLLQQVLHGAAAAQAEPA
jgi:purine-binding chemotaxis protein CheW